MGTEKQQSGDRQQWGEKQRWTEKQQGTEKPQRGDKQQWGEKQLWIERRKWRPRQDDGLLGVELKIREETEPRESFSAEPARMEMPRIRLFDQD